MLYKHAGFALAAEYARRAAPNPITVQGGETRFVLTGDGITVQASYLRDDNLEAALRASLVRPNAEIAGLRGADRQRQLAAGVTRYLKGHRVKVQGDVMHDEFRNLRTGALLATWGLRTSIEFGL